jgi:6-phosphogluconate dehydrogenase (decarboxylating)
VKLIHNAIEFGMVQAIAEGVDLLTRSDYPLDLPALNSSKHSIRRKPVTRASDK